MSDAGALRRQRSMLVPVVIVLTLVVGLCGCSRGPSWTEDERQEARELATRAAVGVGEVTEVVFRDAPGPGSVASGAHVVISIRAGSTVDRSTRRRLFANLTALGMGVDQSTCLRMKSGLFCDDGAMSATVSGRNIVLGILLVRFSDPAGPPIRP
jgi:hypothetical protein